MRVRITSGLDAITVNWAQYLGQIRFRDPIYWVGAWPAAQL